MRRAVTAALACALAAGPVAAPAADPAAVASPVAHALPRALVFKVAYSERGEQRTAVSGLVNPNSNGTMSTPARGTNSSQASSGSDGTVTVLVVAVPSDGIVVDISESSSARTSAPARIGIALDGKLLYDPAKVDLSLPEVELLALLNRGLVEGHDADGASWTVQHLAAGGVKDSTNYRIVSSEPGPILRVELERTFSGAVGARPFDMTETGTIRYDEVKSVPLEASLRAHRVTHQTGQVTTVDSTLTLRLLSDSWHPNG
jgi:hypothetical protein